VTGHAPFYPLLTVRLVAAAMVSTQKPIGQAHEDLSPRGYGAKAHISLGTTVAFPIVKKTRGMRGNNLNRYK